MSSEKNILKSKIGPPAIEDNEFFGRDDELANLKQKVIDGNSVYIAAPRRIGKTSLMHRAKKDLEESGNICFFYDLEGMKSPSEWIRELYNDILWKKGIKITKKAGSLFNNLLINLDRKDLKILNIFSLMDSDQWRRHGEEVLKTLCNSGSCPEGKRIVIFLDELAVMIQNMQQNQSKESPHTGTDETVTVFMRWLRSVRQEKPYKKISFVIASSIGLPPLLKRLNLSAEINDLDTFPFGAWKPDTAKECILALARGREIVISPETAELMTEILGWCSPYFVQVFSNTACNHLFDKKRDSYTIEELKDIYFKYLIRGDEMNAALSHTIERLRKSLSESEYDFAKLILKNVAQNDSFTAKSEIVNIKGEVNEDFRIDVLDILKHDGYIVEEKEGYRFLSNVLRDWWRNKYGK